MLASQLAAQWRGQSSHLLLARLAVGLPVSTWEQAAVLRPVSGSVSTYCLAARDARLLCNRCRYKAKQALTSRSG
jgi:hypothetical protein